MNEWVNRGGGAQDILDDAQLHTSFLSFLDSRAEHELPELTVDARQQFSLLGQLRKTLRMTFFSQTLRPARADTLPDAVSGVAGTLNFGFDIPNIDELNAEQLVDNLDAMASAALRNVSQEVRSVKFGDMPILSTSYRTSSWRPISLRYNQRTALAGSSPVIQAHCLTKWRFSS